MTIRVGDIIKKRTNSRIQPEETTIVRHVGILNGCGHPDSIWSEFDSKWNGDRKAASNGGCLTYRNLSRVVLVTDWDAEDNNV